MEKSVLLAVVLGMILLAGCGSSSVSTNPRTTTPKTTTPKTTTPDWKITGFNYDLDKAAQAGDIAAAEKALAAGADINTKVNSMGWTPLIFAAMGGHTDMATFLLDRGAKVDARDINNNTALTETALNGSIPMAQLLLDRGANVNARTALGKTALTMAAEANHPDLAQFLAQHGGKQ